jgi:hypothetical protein
MNALETLLSSVLQRAIADLHKARADVYTFSFCHDASKGAVSVSADSAVSSRRAVRDVNRASMKRFHKAVAKRDFEEASVWQASVGRSLSLTDFAWKNLARRPLGALGSAPKLHEAMLLTALKHAPEVAALSSDRETLLFTCSTADEEVGLVWTADAPSRAKPKQKSRAQKKAG